MTSDATSPLTKALESLSITTSSSSPAEVAGKAPLIQTEDSSRPGPTPNTKPSSRKKQPKDSEAKQDPSNQDASQASHVRKGQPGRQRNRGKRMETGRKPKATSTEPATTSRTGFPVFPPAGIGQPFPQQPVRPGYWQPQFNAYPPAPPQPFQTAANPQQAPKISARPATPRSHFRSPPATPPPRPVPSADYLQRAANPSLELKNLRSPSHNPLLVILDLNGTLLWRKSRKSPTSFKRRPGLASFVAYLLAHHRVMVWSSARSHNVTNMVHSLAASDGLDVTKVEAMWARDSLRLTPRQYNSRTQVYKRLAWVWDAEEVVKKETEKKSSSSSSSSAPRPPPPPPASRWDAAPGRWDQTNTVLLDDSAEKGAAEPFSLIQLPEYVGDDELEEELCALEQVQVYLEVLRRQTNVSAYIREHPFACMG